MPSAYLCLENILEKLISMLGIVEAQSAGGDTH